MDAQSLVTPKALIAHLNPGLLQRSIPERVVLCDSLGLLQSTAKSLALELDSFLGLKIVEQESAGLRRWLAWGPGPGAPALAITLELLNELGVREVLHLGTAGGIRPGLKVGEVILAKGAFCDEGTSRHYGCQVDQLVGAPPEPLEKWAKHFAQAGLPVITGRLWTTDAIFRENQRAIERFTQLGADAVEMEASAALAVAAKLGLSVICIRVVTDTLSDGQWRPQFLSPAVKAARRKLWNLLAKEPWP